MHSRLLQTPHEIQVTKFGWETISNQVTCALFWQNGKDNGSGEGKVALLINTKLRVCVKCHWAVYEYTRCAYINFQVSAGLWFVPLVTSTYTFPDSRVEWKLARDNSHVKSFETSKKSGRAEVWKQMQLAAVYIVLTH